MKDNQLFLKSLFNAVVAFIDCWATEPNKAWGGRCKFWTHPCGTVVGWSSYDGGDCVLEMKSNGYKVTGGNAIMMASALEKSVLLMASSDFVTKQKGSIGRLKAISRALE